MAQSEGEDENYWPGYVDALTTMTMVLTFIMMVLGITVFSLSQNVSRQLLESVAEATRISPKGSPTSELKDAVLNEIARMTLERDELRRQLDAVTVPQPGPIRPDSQPGPPRQSEQVIASPAARDPQPVLPDRAQGNEPPPVPGPNPAAASPVRPAVLPSEVADAATQTPPSVSAPARGGSQVDSGLRTGLPLTAEPTNDPRHENAAETPADLVNNPPVPPPAGEARVTLRDPRTSLDALPSSGGTIAGPGMLEAAPGDPKTPPVPQDPAMRSPVPPQGKEGENMAMPVGGDPAIAASPVTGMAAMPPPDPADATPRALPRDSARQGPEAAAMPVPPTPDATPAAAAGPPDPKPAGFRPGQGASEAEAPPAPADASQPAGRPMLATRSDTNEPTTARKIEVPAAEAARQPAEPSPQTDGEGGAADALQRGPAPVARDVRSGAPATLTERAAGAKVEASSVLMTVRFAPRATALDPEAKAEIEAFAAEFTKQGGPRDLLIRGIADPTQVGVSEQRRAAYYRALVVRQALIERGLRPEQIATRIEFLRPGDKPDAVEVRLR